MQCAVAGCVVGGQCVLGVVRVGGSVKLRAIRRCTYHQLKILDFTPKSKDLEYVFSLLTSDSSSDLFMASAMN